MSGAGESLSEAVRRLCAMLRELGFEGRPESVSDPEWGEITVAGCAWTVLVAADRVSDLPASARARAGSLRRAGRKVLFVGVGELKAPYELAERLDIALSGEEIAGE